MVSCHVDEQLFKKLLEIGPPSLFPESFYHELLNWSISEITIASLSQPVISRHVFNCYGDICHLNSLSLRLITSDFTFSQSKSLKFKWFLYAMLGLSWISTNIIIYILIMLPMFAK